MNYVLNGELLDESNLQIRVQSEVLNFGIGVFETIKIVRGKPCFLRDHSLRIQESSMALGLSFPGSVDDLREQIIHLCHVNDVDCGAVKLVCYENGGSSDVLLFNRNVAETLSDSMLLCVSDVVQSSNALSKRHKTLNYLDNILSLRSAQSHGFDDCLFLNEHGDVTESSIANVFLITNGTLRTPALNCGVLAGVVRKRVLRIAEEFGCFVEEGRIALSEFAESESVFLTNSLKGLVPIRRIESKMGNWNYKTGGLVERLSERFVKLEIESLLER